MKTCFECDRPAEHDHHVVPQVRGGTRTLPLCGTCHGKVHGLHMTDARALTREALRKKRDQGYRSGNVPFGYRADEDGGLRKDPGEQASVREVLRLRAAGLSYRAIVTQELPGRCGPLRLKAVFHIVRDAEKLVTVRGL